MMLFPRLILLAGIGLTAAACLDDGYGAPRGSYNNGYSGAAPRWGYGQPTGYYGNQQANVSYNRADGRRYTTVTVTNRGQNGYRDQVVQQQVVCGSQYYDGYQTRTAPSC